MSFAAQDQHPGEAGRVAIQDRPAEFRYLHHETRPARYGVGL
jgi:hypothetical protein